jgi:hypothetical protein
MIFVTMTKLALVLIPAVDLLDAARTIRLGRINSCDWLPAWPPATTFLEWAKLGLKDGGDFGLSNALVYAKRSVACRIDGILRTYHMRSLMRSNYPRKIAALNDLGVNTPQIISGLVIDPRNELEHEYQMPNDQAARQAIEIAALFLDATDTESKRSPIVAVNWNVLGGDSGGHVTFDGFTEESMLFIDVFGDPHSANVVNPAHAEIRSARLDLFGSSEAIQLAKLLRANYDANGWSSSLSGPKFFREMKRLGGF